MITRAFYGTLVGINAIGSIRLTSLFAEAQRSVSARLASVLTSGALALANVLAKGSFVPAIGAIGRRVAKRRDKAATRSIRAAEVVRGASAIRVTLDGVLVRRIDTGYGCAAVGFTVAYPVDGDAMATPSALKLSRLAS